MESDGEMMPDQQVQTRRSAQHTFTVDVCIPSDLRERFDARVREYGGDPEKYIREVLERDLRAEAPHHEMTFREIFAPSQQGFTGTGMSEEALSDFVEVDVKTYRAERRERELHGG
jgi:hypothetical protein